MANDYLTLADLALINDKNLADRNISDLLQDAPLLALLPADLASNGTVHKYVKETGAPVVGFRAVNDGRENDTSDDTLVTLNLKILDASFKVDKALADAYIRGPAAYLAREAGRHLRAAFFEAEKQFINGTGNIADGFTGLADALDLSAPTVIDAEGSTADHGSSVYAIRATTDDVVAITGQGGKIMIDDAVVQRVAGATTGFYTAYWTPIQAWLGLQVGGIYSAGRLCNLTEQANHTLTDDFLAELIATFPAGRQPTHLVMSRRSRKQLQQSRTATNPTGAPAPFPTEAFGVPIVVTDGVLDTEDIVTGT